MIFGLAQIAEAGYEVDPDGAGAGRGLAEPGAAGMDPRTAGLCAVRPGRGGLPNAEATRELAAERRSLDDDGFSLAGLALASDIIGETSQARTLLDELAAQAVSGDRSGVLAGRQPRRLLLPEDDGFRSCARRRWY